MAKLHGLGAFEAKKTLANRFIPRIDRLRQLVASKGLRPYRVWMVWDKYNGESYGDGERKEIARVEITPSPKVESIDNMTQSLMHPGMVSEGTVRLTKISGRFTYDQLRGLMIPDHHEDHIPAPYAFYYEVVEDGRGDAHPVRLKFRLLTLPHRRAGHIDWTLSLQKVSGDNDRTGESTYGR